MLLKKYSEGNYIIHIPFMLHYASIFSSNSSANKCILNYSYNISTYVMLYLSCNTMLTDTHIPMDTNKCFSSSYFGSRFEAD